MRPASGPPARPPAPLARPITGPPLQPTFSPETPVYFQNTSLARSRQQGGRHAPTAARHAPRPGSGGRDGQEEGAGAALGGRHAQGLAAGAGRGDPAGRGRMRAAALVCAALAAGVAVAVGAPSAGGQRRTLAGATESPSALQAAAGSAAQLHKYSFYPRPRTSASLSKPATAAAALPAVSGFVKRDGLQFTLNGNEFTFAGG